ncbi:MAG: AmmeMemoRadiSam system protein B [Methanomicrobiales archaeon]|nr:AmmeMemoRadiSam system protein B [Methanomicrobiales archaeon]
MTRRPSVAGMFYPDNPSRLREMITTFFQRAGVPGSAMGVVSPHAGYVYSGHVAARAINALPKDFAGTIIIIGPSHEGYMTCASAEPWATPLGTVENDTGLVDALDIPVDEFSHRNEHSLEVQVPFIQTHLPEAKIAPVMMGNQTLRAAEHLAERILHAIRSTNHDVRIVASSDFSHYVPESVAQQQDNYAIEALAALDVAEFYRRIRDEGVSACGYGPICTMCLVCRELGAGHADLLQYTTSAEMSGDTSHVVGYAAIAVM